ncbi:sodium-independent sulfate anion transporter isoform X2 [Tyto alba]|uniref:sodium-independent sulfate anion transporter isoform X2 n=1 Tax=Tyto alba TaxID=56313 RepID=UPI001C680AE9|nr:sodium-independent sulfate anion transporter isoform X2 [Tyto alba]
MPVPVPRRSCRCPGVRRRLPVLRWLPRYSLAWLQLDLIAGLTVGLTVVPQALAYAEVAGLPLQYGLYSSFMGCFVYCFLGTAKDVTLGPTAIMSLLVSSYAFHEPVYAVLLAFLSGCIQLAMGLLHLGFLLDFISCPVIKGFTSAASVTISFSQVKNILGLQGIPRQFFLQAYEMLRRIGETRAADAVLGLGCLAALAGLRAMKSRLPRAAPAEPLAARVSYLIVWTSATARNALVVLFAGLVAYSFQVTGSQPLTLTGSIPHGLPAFRPPRFSMAAPNGTVPFQSMVEDMGAGLAVVPLMGLLETIAIAKAFASQNDYRIDPNQELLAMGFANILGSFVSSYPITGSFGRTAVNAQSGVCTPAGGLVTGTLVLLSLAYLTSLFYYIPKAALAAVIISAVVPMFDAGIFRTLWRVKSEGRSRGRSIPRYSPQSRRCPRGPCGTRTRRSWAWVVSSCRAGPCASLRDVPALLLGGPVRYRGRGAGLRDSPALPHCQAPNKGVGGGRAPRAAGEQPALPSRRAPPGRGVQPRSGSLSTTLRRPGLSPHQQHRLHGGGGAGRAAAGAAQARPLAGLLQAAGPCSPSPAVRRIRRIPAFPQPGGGRAVRRSGAGGQRGSPPHQHQRELTAAHGTHPVSRGAAWDLRGSVAASSPPTAPGLCVLCRTKLRL